MKQHYSLYLSKIADVFNNGTIFNKQNNFFIKHYNTMDIPEEEVRQLLGERDIRVLSYRFSNSRMQDAYEPILEWIRALYLELINEDMSVFLTEANVYELHKPIFESFIMTGKCRRKEDIFIPEIEYDRERFITSLINILTYLSKKKTLIFILNRLHFAPASMIDFLECYLLNNELSSIVFLGTFNEAFNMEKGVLPKWKHLLELLHTQSNVMEWDLKDIQDTAVERTNFIPVISKYPRYLEKIENMLETLAVDQAYYYLELLIYKIEMEKSNISVSIHRALLENYIKACIYKQDTDRATRICEKLRMLGEKNTYSLNNYEYYRLLTLTKTYRGQYEEGKRYAEILVDIASSIGNEFYLFKAHIIRFIALNEGFNSVVIRTNYSEASKELYEAAEKFGYRNMQAYLLVMSFDNIDNTTLTKEEIDYQENMFNRGIQVAKALDNCFCQHMAYKKNVLMASFYGHYDLVNIYSEKCIENLKVLKNPIEEAVMYYTLGYHDVINEKYAQSDECFDKAIGILIEEKRLVSACEGLYNNGINAMRARDFQGALKSFTTAIMIMKDRKLYILNVCSMTKLYGLTAYCYYWVNDYYNLSLLYSEMERFLSPIYNSDQEIEYLLLYDDLFLFYLTNSLLCINEGKYRLAHVRMDSAKKFMDLASGSYFLFRPMFTVILAQLYRLEENEELAVRTLSQGMEFCKENGYVDNYKNLENLLTNNTQLIHTNIIKQERYGFDELLELSKQEVITAELIKKNNNMDFLFNWQNVVSQQTNKNTLINVSLAVLQSNFNVDQIIYINKDEEEDCFDIVYSYKQNSLTQQQIKVIKDRLEFETNGFAAAKVDRKVDNYKEIISFFEYDNIWSLICVPIVVNDKVTSILIAYNEVYSNVLSNEGVFLDDDIAIIKYAFRELTDAIEQLKAREKIMQINNELVKSSITDTLTGAYNRLGLIKIVNDLNDQLLYSNENRNKYLTVLYIDLDNFKYYNDNFGHDVGDMVLREFTNIVKLAIGDKGYCSRFGGDEFVLLLVDANEKQGEVVARNIFHYIKKENYFIKKVENLLDIPISVDNDSKISCSIGVADTILYDIIDINDVLKRADKALYYVKNTTKQGYQLWSQLSDLY